MRVPLLCGAGGLGSGPWGPAQAASFYPVMWFEDGKKPDAVQATSGEEGRAGETGHLAGWGWWLGKAYQAERGAAILS